MVNESLTEYINRQLKAGYDVGTIRSTLINAGYSPYDVDQALGYSGAVGKHKSIALTGKAVIIAISAIILILLMIIGGIMLLSPEPKFIEHTILPTKTELYPGEKLPFLNEFSSEQSKTASVLVNYEAIDRRTSQTIASKQEKLEIGKRRSTTIEITIPADASQGEYMLMATINYDGKTQQKSFEFMLLEKPAIEVSEQESTATETVGQCPATCDDYNKCTQDTCEKGICRHAPITPCCGNGICEQGENKLNCIDDCREREETPEQRISQASTVALTDPETAAVICSSIINSDASDACFSQIALASRKSMLCESVNSPDNRDRCYMGFALEGDYTVCANVKNSYMLKACNSLKRTETIQTKVEQMAKEQNLTLQSA